MRPSADQLIEFQLPTSITLHRIRGKCRRCDTSVDLRFLVATVRESGRMTAVSLSITRYLFTHSFISGKDNTAGPPHHLHFTLSILWFEFCRQTENLLYKYNARKRASRQMSRPSTVWVRVKDINTSKYLDHLRLLT